MSNEGSASFLGALRQTRAVHAPGGAGQNGRVSPSPFLGLRTCIVNVPDLEAAKAWYAKAFGAAPYFDQPFYAGFEIGGYELGLVPNEAGLAPRGSVCVHWGVEDVAASYERLLSLGAAPNDAPQDVGDGIVVATVLDPWDNVLGIIRNPHFKLA